MRASNEHCKATCSGVTATHQFRVCEVITISMHFQFCHQSEVLNRNLALQCRG